MKKLITLLITLLISFSNFAQTGINYKAVIKDTNGNVVATQTIDVRFTIIVDGGAGDYVEKHTATTDTNGILIVNIGEGTEVISGEFVTINWTNNVNLLKTEIDIERDGTFENMGITSFKFVPYAIQAVRASEADNVTGLEAINEGNGIGWRLAGRDPANYGSIGSNAIDLSYSSFTNLGATGNYSTAIGSNVSASSEYSTAIGIGTIASGAASVALGNLSTASGEASTTMGEGTRAMAFASTAIGFETTASGDHSFATGRNTNAIMANSTAMGGYTTASGIYSTAMGNDTSASGNFSTSMGSYTTASGMNSTALGDATSAVGNNSTSLGNATSALGTNSIAMGLSTIAVANSSTAIGKYNVADINGLFMVGNGTGTSAANRKNAFIVKDDGKIGVNSSSPTSLFEVVHENVLPTPTNRTNALSIKNSSNNNSFQLATHFNGSLTLYSNGTYLGYFHNTTGTYIAVSDRRLKKDITPLDNGTLQKVLQLNPVSYLMKDQTDTNINLGLISQEVQELFPSITHYSKEQDILSLSYTELIPILIKAIQEQQTIIENQNSKIRTFESSLTELSQRIKSLEASNNQ